MTRVGLTWLTLLVGVALGVAICFDDPGIVGGATNADMLWPASFVWDATSTADGWRGHYLPRLPSIVPDLLTWGSLSMLTRSVRWTILAYGWFQMSAFVAVGGWIASRIAGRSWIVGAATMLATLAILLVAGLAGLGGIGMITNALLPIIHFGPMLLALLGAAIAARRVARGGSAWAVGAVASAVFLSDQLLLVEFAGPVVVATLLLVVTREVRPSRALGVVAWTIAGVVFGSLVLRGLMHAGVRVDHTPGILVADMTAAVHRFLGVLPALIGQVPVLIVVLGVAVVAFAGFGWWLLGRARRSPAAEPERVEQLFLWLFLGLSACGSVVFTAGFFTDSGSLRYLIGLWCCVVVVLAGCLSRVVWTPRIATALVAATALAALAGFVSIDRGRIAVLDWEPDVAACIRRLRGPLDLHAGLAEYWVARPTEVALGWSTQVSQITGDGYAYPWDTDPRWFRHALADPARHPDYDFFVMRSLDQDRILTRFGVPDRVERCADTAIWLYRDSGRLYHPVTDGLPPD